MFFDSQLFRKLKSLTIAHIQKVPDFLHGQTIQLKT